MIKLDTDEKNKIVYPTWILKLNKDQRKRTNKLGEEKTYYSYFTSFPQELYDFFDISDESIFLVKDISNESDIIITDTEPTLPVNHVKTKLILRRKNDNKGNRIPTTSFTLSRKLFNNLNQAKEVKFILHPKIKDKYRNKLGMITIELIQ